MLVCELCAAMSGRSHFLGGGGGGGGEEFLAVALGSIIIMYYNTFQCYKKGLLHVLIVTCVQSFSPLSACITIVLLLHDSLHAFK